MVRTNLQEFVGDVHVLSNLQVGSNLFANDLAANVLTIAGNVAAEYFIGDGGFLSNIATTLDDIISNPNGNSVSNTVVFISGQDPIANTAIVTYANVGISVSNTNPTGEYQLSIGSNIFVNTHASNVLTIIGSVGANTFIGDGGLLSNIATTLDAIIDQGNTVSNTIQLISGADVTSNTGLVTHKDVGISVSNTEPTGEFQFGVGSNLLVNVYSSNVLAIEGNVNAQKMTLGTITVTSAYGLNHVTAQGSVTGDTISLTNATTGLTADSNIVVGGNVTAETVITSANVEVGDRLKFASNVFVDDLRVADVAANLVTYDKTTGELMDSGGLFANKIAVVSVQPPSALSANTTTIAKHGTYTVTTSGLESTSNAWNAFDGDSAVEWKSIFVGGRLYDAGGLYTGPTRLATTTKQGEWLAIEFPYKTTLRHMKLTPPAEKTQYPASANVYATNDSLTWTELVNWSGVDPGDQQSNVQTIIVNATEPFKKYAMVVTKTNEGTDNTALAEWKLFTESFSIDGGKVEMATSAVMGGETTMDQHGPHGRDGAAKLKKYPEIAFESGKFDTTANGTDSTYWAGPSTVIQGGYSLKTSHHSNDSGGQFGWHAFDGNEGTIWKTAEDYDVDGNYDYGYTSVQQRLTDTNSTNHDGDHVIMGSPNKLKIAKVVVTCKTASRRVVNYSVLGSNSTGTTGWTLLNSGTFNAQDVNIATITSPTTYFKYHAFVARSITADADGTRFQINSIDFYGYEELATQGDTSVDTTFTSIMNTPQTTGANVYVDGNLGETFTNRVTGPTVSNTHTTYVSAEKYWELSGNVESNVTVEANTFLEGDAPHSVSVWFNSSNLEANVSNTCVFSISDQEKLDSVNLDLQSNTWHNLTYAYQGEGGSRVTYLDGRKVAEDQAEDTFGEYPPFAMTGYSRGGYVVSSNSEYNTTSYPVWEAFDDSSSSSWASNTSRFDGSGIATSASVFNPGGGDVNGPYVKIEMPHKLALSYFDIVPQTSTGTACPPKKINLYASNDDTNWVYLLTDEVVNVQPGVTKTVTASTQTKYKYFILQVTEMNPGTSVSAPAQYTWTQISNLSFYGHRENDLVRLPDPTNVLKYPHIAMTGPAQRGYVASASANHTNGGHPTWKAFDGVITNDWETVTGRYSDSGGGVYTHNAGETTVTNVQSRVGDWVQLESPHKIRVKTMKFTPVATYGQERSPATGVLLGSNDNGSTWTEIKLFDVTADGTPNSYTAGSPTTLAIDSGSNSTPGYYKIHRLIWLTLYTAGQTTYADRASVADLEFFGTEENSSVPIQIGGGNIDKVANFRVYDKFVGEDQALEIWDAQKDLFREVKNSMTLHKGRLGIGTTEPEGRLAVLDEPHNLEEFPPRAMTGYKNYFEGHGEFCVSASSELSDTYNIQNVFNKITTIGDSSQAWISGGSPDTFVTSTGLATAENSFEGVNGPWIKLELPYNVKPKKVQMFMRTTSESNSSRRPKSGIVYGRKDGMYHQITNFDFGSTDKDIPLEELNLNTRDYYSEFVLQITSMYLTGASTDAIAIKGINFFGTREQGQSVLHDGELTLTKNLNVPRIGPALDADDTPRRDRLVVEYNTSTNPTFEGAVKDTSGRGNDGVFYGTNMNYSSTEKALVFNGTDDYARSIRLNNTGGDYIHSVSWWFKTDITTSAIGTNEEVMWHLGDAWAARICSYASFYGNRIYLAWNTYNINCATTNINQLQWNHACVTYTGGGSSLTSRKFYLNGELEPAILDNVEGTLLNLPANTLLTLGARKPTATNTIASTYFDGQISNFKLYDTALTAEEVKTLYDMGRCDEGHHVVNFSKTRVGIGLGDGEAPRAALDVRDVARFHQIDIRHDTEQDTVINFSHYLNTSIKPWQIGQIMGLNPTGANNSDFKFATNGVVKAWIDSSTSAPTTEINNFTGQHRTFIKDVPFSQVGDLEGLIVSSDQNKYIKMSGGIEAGSNAITTNESLPVVSLSNVATDKKCFGVISASEDPETRQDRYGNIISVSVKEKGDTRAYINSVGEGAIWVVNTNGSLESGDYITTSNVAGYGQKQDDDVLHNYTVAKITMDCDFEPATQPVQQILRSNVVETYYLGNVHKVKNVPHEFVTTVVGAMMIGQTFRFRLQM
jgi:hypothetical protein